MYWQDKAKGEGRIDRQTLSSQPDFFYKLLLIRKNLLTIYYYLAGYISSVIFDGLILVWWESAAWVDWIGGMDREAGLPSSYDAFAVYYQVRPFIHPSSIPSRQLPGGSHHSWAARKQAAAAATRGVRWRFLGSMRSRTHKTEARRHECYASSLKTHFRFPKTWDANSGNTQWHFGFIVSASV